MGCRGSIHSTACRIAFLVIGLVSLGGGPPASAQPSRGAFTDVPKLPDGPVGQRITELLEAVNANDPEKVRALVNNAFTAEFRDFAPMERHQAVFAGVYNRSRGLEFHSIRQYGEKAPADEVVVILRGKLAQDWHAISMTIEPKPPHRISGLRFGPARPPLDQARETKLTDAQIVQELKTFVERLAAADAFSGTVLLAKNGTVLFEGAYGPASKRFNVPNKLDTKFNLGSMNKMFTGVAVTQLVQQGRLSLTDQLSKFVSTEWLPREITDRIQIQHLLTHTSGLGSYFNDKYAESSRALFRDLDDYLPLIVGSTLAFEPGTDWQYSNTGMFLLGLVIEKVTGQDYFDYVRQHIYRPAGMINSDCYEMDKPVPNLAIGYTRDGDEWRNNLYLHVIRGGPAGGGFSTVRDLLRFDQALRNHKLLDREHTELVWSAKPELNSPDYGFGFGVQGEPGNRIVGHSGGFPGINANLDMFLDSGYTSVVMSNYSHGAQPIASKIKELLTAGR